MFRRATVPLLLALLVLPLLALPSAAQRAVPPLTGRVVDLGGILSADTEAALTSLLAAHEDSTGNQVAVLTVPSLEGAVLEDYALAVARTWALGTAAQDNGVLLLIAVADRKMRIEVGLGLEGTLTDALAGRIIRNEIRPRFRAGDFNEGVLVGVAAITGVIEGTYTPPDDAEDNMPWWFGAIFLLLPTLFAAVAVVMPGCARWFLFVFLMPFFLATGFMVAGHVIGGVVALGLYVILFIWGVRHPAVRAAQKKLKAGEAAKVGPFTVSGGSGFSGGGSSWSSGGSSFSGGGGSFGGGGASGGW